MKKIYVTRPSMPPMGKFLPYLKKIWASKQLTNEGPFHLKLEKALCEYLGVKYLSLFNNGTTALMAALRALQIKGEVITTPYSFVATAHTLMWSDIRPIFVDVDPNTLNLDPRKIEAAITSKTTAILPVHCYGRPCDVERIDKIAKAHKLRVIYDAAHAFGVQTKSGSILKHGDLSILSFHATKVFTTFEGGAIVSPNANIKRHIDLLRSFGFVDEVTVAAVGINGKMDEISAAFGLLQIKGIRKALQKRRAIDRRYCEGLTGVQGVYFLPGKGEYTANNSYFPIFIRPEYPISRDGLYDKLRREGIYARRYFYPLISDLPMYRRMPSAARANLPVAFKAANEVLCLPIYPDLSQGDVDRVIRIIREGQGKRAKRSV